RAARQGPVVVRRHADQSLQQGIVAQHLGVVAIGIAGEDLIDILRENGFAGNTVRLNSCSRACPPLALLRMMEMLVNGSTHPRSYTSLPALFLGSSLVVPDARWFASGSV